MTQNLLSKIRLTADELQAIQETFTSIFLPNDHLWLFGSRADKQKRGGDIDLYIETNVADFADCRARQERLVLRLWEIIGEQRIDVVTNRLNSNNYLSIYDIAKQTGVQII